MISNINSARALIQADLDHARHVLQLWQDQVNELEEALKQLDAVDASRDVLRVEYQGQKGGDSMLNMDAAAQKTVSANGPGRQQRSKANGRAASDAGSETPTPKRRGPGKKQKAPAVKYRDPASTKTWSGRGRKPFWMRGDPDQYLVSNLRVANGGNPDAVEAANQAKV